MTREERRQFSKFLRRIDWIVEHGTDEQRAALDKMMRTLKRLKEARNSGARVTMKDAGTDIWLVIDGKKAPTRDELEKRMDEQARQYTESHDPKIKAEIEELSHLLAKWNETLH